VPFLSVCVVLLCSQLECQHDMKMLSVLLPLLVTFTSSNGWKIINSKAGRLLAVRRLIISISTEINQS